MKRASFQARTLILLAPLLCAFDPLRSSNREVEQGNAAMKAGKAEQALAHYDRAVTKLPADAGAHFDRGTALYALSRFDEAGQEFLRATEARDGSLKETAFFNLGNAFFKKDKFKEAVEAYKRALALDPRDQRAKWNLEIALRKQKDEEEKKKKKNDEKEKEKEKDKGKNKPDQQQPPKNDKNDKNDKHAEQPPPPKDAADQQEIEAVLDSLERSPKDLEKQRARMRVIRRRPPARDW
jgi:Ca-activated chloride channel family protein